MPDDLSLGPEATALSLAFAPSAFVMVRLAETSSQVLFNGAGVWARIPDDPETVAELDRALCVIPVGRRVLATPGTFSGILNAEVSIVGSVSAR